MVEIKVRPLNCVEPNRMGQPNLGKQSEKGSRCIRTEVVRASDREQRRTYHNACHTSFETYIV